jgi:hypothetical protein
MVPESATPNAPPSERKKPAVAVAIPNSWGLTAF